MRKSSNDLVVSEGDLTVFDKKIDARIDSVEKSFHSREHALYKQLGENEAKEDASGWFFCRDRHDANGADGADVKKQWEAETETEANDLRATTVATMRELLKQLPQNGITSDFKPEFIQSILETSAGTLSDRVNIGREEIQRVIS